MFRFSLFVLAALSLTAAERDPLDRLLDRQDRAALEQQATTLHAEAAKNPGDAKASYRAALAYSYAAEVAMEMRDKSGSEKYARAGSADAERAVSLQPNNAEYHRLLGTLYGQVIPANPLVGALTFAKRAKDSLEKAMALDPKNPRVWIAHGVGFFYLPTSMGGGPDNAIQDYRKAIALDPKSAEAYLWMGIAHKRNHQDKEAREALKKSLELNPDQVWAKQQLASISAP